MRENNLTIEKSTIDNYKIRNGYEHASISIDSKGDKGTIQISSSYGSWSYYWGACGESFLKFLSGLDIHYTAGKFGESSWFDMDATYSYLKNRVEEYKTDDTYKSLKEELKEVKNASCKEEFIHIVSSCENIMDIENHCPDMQYDISPSFRNFWDKLWVPFINQIQDK